ncbi:hypothetical protein V8G54_034151 [Vigna mungo]|uniref:Uncharacterized protein n=1 Tax=Vigna mungo TaxID=3915 RepID=A0AAQ3MQA4_VIGMU
MRNLTTHKFLKLSFIRNEGFQFQSWLKCQGLKKFVEMADPWYPELVKVFYYNLRIIEGTLCYRVKGIDKKLTDEIWTDNLRNPEDIQDYSHYKTARMKKDDRLAVFVISWTLATTEDLYLLKAFKENIQVDWPAAISDNMLKVTRLESAMLSYCVFLSRFLFILELTALVSQNEVAEEEEEFERTLLREIKSLKFMCQGTKDDIFQNRNKEEENEDDSGEEGSTPVETTVMKEEENEDDDVAEESNSDMLLRTYLKKNKKKI